MLSQQDVYSRLAGHFIGLRLDWEQGNHYRDKFGSILGTGDQLLLTPEGEVIRSPKPNKDGQPTVIHGRNGADTTAEVLDKVIRQHPEKSAALQLEWFFWEQKPTKRRGGFYPASFTSIAGYARLPYVLLEGPVPDALADAGFLRWHVRQFIWVRGQTNGESRLVIRRVKDGLRAGLSTELAVLRPATMTWQQLGEGLDRAWLAYMKDRPLTARGYLENAHGKWMRGQAVQMINEDDTVRARALEGTLLAPGRKPGQPAPYVSQVRDQR